MYSNREDFVQDIEFKKKSEYQVGGSLIPKTKSSAHNIILESLLNVRKKSNFGDLEMVSAPILPCSMCNLRPRFKCIYCTFVVGKEGRISLC